MYKIHLSKFLNIAGLETTAVCGIRRERQNIKSTHLENNIFQ